MTDITDQDIRNAREWAERQDKIGRTLQDIAARVILATVDAPAPTLAEELRGIREWVDREAADGFDKIVARAEQMASDMSSMEVQIRGSRHTRKTLERERIDAIREQDSARAEVERLTAERVTDPSPTLNDGSMTRPATVAREENVYPDLPDPTDVKPGEAWIVNIDGVEIVPGFKASVGWICYRFFGGTTKAIGDERITLIARLVPAPRVITNTEELEALAEGTIVRDKDGDAWRRTCDEWTTTADYGRFTSWAVSRSGPVTVLWEPEVAA